MMETDIDDGLQELKGMTPKVLRLLAEEGITSLRRLSMSTVDDLSRIEGITDNRARTMIYDARERLGMCEFVAVDKLDENWEWFTTGSENVDDLMDGGITTGRITELFGGFKSGKTNTVNTLCVTVQLPKDEGGLDGDVVYIDTEGTFSKAKVARIARRFGIEPGRALGRIHLAKVYSADHQMQMIEACEKLITRYPVRLVIVDSLMALLRNEYVGIGCLAPRQAKLNRIIHTLSQLAETYNLAVVLTNQVVTKMMGQIAYEDAVGGNIVSHGCHFRYRLKAKGFSYNEALERYITVVDSVDLAPGTATFCITEAGIADEDKIRYRIKEPSSYEVKERQAALAAARAEAGAGAPDPAAKGKAKGKAKPGARASSDYEEDLSGDDPVPAPAPAPVQAPAPPASPSTGEDVPDVPKEQVRDTLNCPSCGKVHTSQRQLDRHVKACKPARAAGSAGDGS